MIFSIHMHSETRIKKNIVLEIVKWVFITLLLITVIIGYICYQYDVYLKNIVLFIIILFIACVVLTTRLGRSAVVFGKEVYLELQKVIWPSYQDSLNTTLVVIAVTTIISLILWGLDTVLVHVISFGLRL